MGRRPRDADGGARRFGVGQVHVGARFVQSVGLAVQSLWVVAGADQRDDDGKVACCSIPGSADRGRQLGRGVRVGAVTQDDVEEQYAAARVGGLVEQPAYA